MNDDDYDCDDIDDETDDGDHDRDDVDDDDSNHHHMYDHFISSLI